MSSYMLLKKLSSLPLDKQKYAKLQDEKEELNKNLHEVLPLLKEILRHQDNICRICLQTGSRAIFQPENTNDLAADILYALGIEINQDDTGPQCICYSCEKGIMAAAELKRMANISNWRLQQEAELVTKTFSQCSESSHTEGLHGGYFTLNKGIVERTWRCGKCRKLFQSQEELIAHEAQVSCRRRRIEPYVCEVCGKEFRRAFPLNQHRAIHSNELLYPCTLCPYRGRTRAALVGHIKLHSGEKTIQCPQCPATFASYSNLGSHRRTHNPPKYKCYHCNKSFMFQQSLKNHIISQHSSTKAYNCIGCDKSFALRKHLRQHELKAHNRPKCNAGAVPLYIKLQVNNSE